MDRRRMTGVVLVSGLLVAGAALVWRSGGSRRPAPTPVVQMREALVAALPADPREPPRLSTPAAYLPA
jgi:hypothetical protein